MIKMVREAKILVMFMRIPYGPSCVLYLPSEFGFFVARRLRIRQFCLMVSFLREKKKKKKKWVIWFKFPLIGGHQSARFSDIFSGFLKDKEIIAELRKRGYDAADFGSHSLRKGGSSFAAGGTTDAPAQMCIILRAGWTLSKVEKAYFRFERAGDQYLGRILCGLPIHAGEFATLPPTFRTETKEDGDLVNELLKSCFMHFPERMQGVLSCVLASVIYHADWIRDHVPPGHLLFNTPLFLGYNVNDLKRLVFCGMAKPRDALQPTGVPTHVSTKLKIEQLESNQREILAAIEGVHDRLEEDLRSGLNDFAVSQGHLTLDAVTTLFTNVLNAKFATIQPLLEQRLGENAEEPVAEADAQHDDVLEQERPQLCYWGGRYHMIPQNFELSTTASSRQAFVLWVCGSKEKKYPPLCFVSPQDMATKNLRKRFSDLKKWMEVIESKAKDDDETVWPRQEDGTFRKRLSLTQANAVFDAVEHYIVLGDKTPKGRERRFHQMAWTSHYKVWRELRKRNGGNQGARPRRARDAESEGSQDVSEYEEEPVMAVPEEPVMAVPVPSRKRIRK
jgi:hypothetical protein